MTHNVFISYSNKDKIIADKVCTKLEENNIRVWMAPRDVPNEDEFCGKCTGGSSNCPYHQII